MRRVVFKARFLWLFLLAMIVGVWPMAAQAAAAGPTAPALNTAANYAVLAGTAVTCTGGTITGNVGESPGSAVTINAPCTINGTIDKNNPAAIQANKDFFTAYSALAPKSGDVCTTETGTLAGVTLAPGVYCFDAAAAVTGVLTLRGPANGVWIFKIGASAVGALTGTNFTVRMAGGGNPCNAFWWVRDGVTFSTSTLVGTILAGGTDGAVSFTDTSLTGRAWATTAVTTTRGSIVGCTAAGTVPGTKCKPGTGNGEDENADQSKDTAEQSKDTGNSNKSASTTAGASQSSNGDSKDGNGKQDNDEGNKSGCDSDNSNHGDNQSKDS
ncbi:MAG TPA: ice-binding family protein [Candidatus Dormibacteraeota bacterium]